MMWNITDEGHIYLHVICYGCCSGRYYYWNTETDEVSWLSPQHPRAVITLPAERLKGFASVSFADEYFVCSLSTCELSVEDCKQVVNKMQIWS